MRFPLLICSLPRRTYFPWNVHSLKIICSSTTLYYITCAQAIKPTIARRTSPRIKNPVSFRSVTVFPLRYFTWTIPYTITCELIARTKILFLTPYLPSWRINEKIAVFLLRENVRAPDRNASKPRPSIDSRRHSVVRPSSPPPPLPVKRHSNGKTQLFVFEFFDVLL